MRKAPCSLLLWYQTLINLHGKTETLLYNLSSGLPNLCSARVSKTDSRCLHTLPGEHPVTCNTLHPAPVHLLVKIQVSPSWRKLQGRSKHVETPLEFPCFCRIVTRGSRPEAFQVPTACHPGESWRFGSVHFPSACSKTKPRQQPMAGHGFEGVKVCILEVLPRLECIRTY